MHFLFAVINEGKTRFVWTSGGEGGFAPTLHFRSDHLKTGSFARCRLCRAFSWLLALGSVCLLFPMNACAEDSERLARRVSFELDIQPVLTSLGCNSGPCHGKQRGQNGFQLSLLGFDSDFDHAAITREGRGRRIFPAAPERSLLVQKATAELPHGGGRRIDVDSDDYRTLIDWIRDGAPRKIRDEPNLIDVELNQTEIRLQPGESFGLQVIAHYSDGSFRDVTSRTSFQSNQSVVASVGKDGHITAGELPGETAIMARYLQNIAVCNVLIPLASGPDGSIYQQLPSHNFIDELIWRKLADLSISPSRPIDDAKFLRRVYIDIIGRIPTADEARRFLEHNQTDKRQRLVDELLESPEYAEHWANQWADLLRPNPYRVGIKAVLNYDHWIRQRFRENQPYDEFVRELVTATGSTWTHGAATMFRDRRSPDEVATLVSQLFLGIRLECAKCHHHPFEKWGQDDFYGFAAYFANVGRKGTGLSPPISGSEEIILPYAKGSVRHPLTDEVVAPKTLFGESPTIEPGGDPRRALVEWLTSPTNDYFAKVQVNRIWTQMMGRGIVEPVDDLRSTNPPVNAQLLDALADYFRESDFDNKAVIRLIANSYVYSLGSIPNQYNVGDHRNYSRNYRRRIRAEVLMDSLANVTEVEPVFQAMPLGSEAREIWTTRVNSTFLDTFGRPNPNQDPPCERLGEATMTQALHLMNASDLQRRIADAKGRCRRLAESDQTATEVVSDLYLSIYSRYPIEEERRTAVAYLEQHQENRQLALEDLMWAMVNSPEFSYRD